MTSSGETWRWTSKAPYFFAVVTVKMERLSQPFKIELSTKQFKLVRSDGVVYTAKGYGGFNNSGAGTGGCISCSGSFSYTGSSEDVTDYVFAVATWKKQQAFKLRMYGMQIPFTLVRT
jgi:hypothetical protein